jgi:hypothetical protein
VDCVPDPVVLRKSGSTGNPGLVQKAEQSQMNQVDFVSTLTLRRRRRKEEEEVEGAVGGEEEEEKWSWKKKEEGE